MRLKTLKQKRVEAEKAAEKAGRPIRYPTADELRAEADEEAPTILLSVNGADGKPVRVLTGSAEKGLQRVAWDLRAPAHQLPPNRPRGELDELFGDPLVGPYVVPGTYNVDAIAARGRRRDPACRTRRRSKSSSIPRLRTMPAIKRRAGSFRRSCRC